MQDALKGYPDDLLAREVSQPSGSVPSYLAISELQRRKDMRDRYAAQQAPQSTVAEDLTMGIMGVADQGGMPSAPMMAPPPQPPMQDPVMRMSRGGLTQGMGGLPQRQLDRLAQLQAEIDRITKLLAGQEADPDPFAGEDVNPFEMGVEGENTIIEREGGILDPGSKSMAEQIAESLIGSPEESAIAPPAPVAPAPQMNLAAEAPTMQGEFLKKLMERYAGQDERARQNALLSLGTSLMTSKSPTFLGALGEAGQTGIKTLQAGQQASDKMLGELAGLEAKSMQKRGAKETIDSINALAKAAETTFNPEEKQEIFKTIEQLRAKLASQLGLSSGETAAGPSQDLLAEMRKRGLL